MEIEPEEEESCKICMEECDAYDDPAVRCIGDCEQCIHVRCLKRGALPSNLFGDVFYDLHCADCSGSKEEVLVRQKLSWLTTVVLTLYNLQEKSPGLSRRGYYHWKSDISTFISNNWDHLFGKTVKRKKNWTGTISGTLSHCNGTLFKSGTPELGEQGWWKLGENEPPEIIVGKYYRELEIRKRELKEKNTKRANPDTSIIGNNNRENELHTYKKNGTPNGKENGVDLNQCPSESAAPYNEFADILDLGIDKPNLEDDFPSFNFTASGMEDDVPLHSHNELPESFLTDCHRAIEKIDIDESSGDFDIASKPSENLPDLNGTAVVKDEFDDPVDHKDVTYDRSELPVPEPTLFNQSILRPWPWDESIKLNPDDLRPMMSVRQEEYLLQKIEQFKHALDSAPSSVRRLYRKLCVRKMKRQYGLPILDVDNFGKDSKLESSSVRRKGNAVLDRFISEDISMFFEQRLQGHCEPTAVHSPYTSRILKPFIRRDTSSRPLWMKLMSELTTRVNRKIPDWKQKEIAPIDYSYIRPQHIPAINYLCTQFFWPGVDLTECLQYPDFTCVVLYKKLVIGFAIMVPDVGYNEAYISFLLVRPEWQKAGIGTFMLYHLIQTCMGKDITLHVSATNPALILYQKFGFKQEEFVQDFYDKYMPVSSRESRHALFLRLGR